MRKATKEPAPQPPAETGTNKRMNEDETQEEAG
jgi:hypothetical protein